MRCDRDEGCSGGVVDNEGLKGIIGNGVGYGGVRGSYL